VRRGEMTWRSHLAPVWASAIRPTRIARDQHAGVTPFGCVLVVLCLARYAAPNANSVLVVAPHDGLAARSAAKQGCQPVKGEPTVISRAALDWFPPRTRSTAPSSGCSEGRRRTCRPVRPGHQTPSCTRCLDVVKVRRCPHLNPPSPDIVFDTLFASRRCAARSRLADAWSSWRWSPIPIGSRRSSLPGSASPCWGGTPAGDAYTFDELRDQLEKAGFADVSSHPLPTPETVIVARAI
jgi:hypothetical protein